MSGAGRFVRIAPADGGQHGAEGLSTARVALDNKDRRWVSNAASAMELEGQHSMNECERDHCCAPPPAATLGSTRFRRALWIALIVNGVMFVVEFAFSFRADSVSLLADAVDFFGDAANYALSLFVLGFAAVWRSRAALLKGITMGIYGVFVLGKVAWSAAHDVVPDAPVMGIIGFIALLANLGVAALLYAHREGDANMRSVWLCTRNDAISNAAVLLAAAGVFGTASGWPDMLVALVMGVLALASARSVVRQALGELQEPSGPIGIH